MTRPVSTHADVTAGCFDCNGSDALWTSRNAMALAARHHDATGHRTWAEQHLSIRYGEESAVTAQTDLFREAAL